VQTTLSLELAAMIADFCRLSLVVPLNPSMQVLRRVGWVVRLRRPMEVGVRLTLLVVFLM